MFPTSYTTQPQPKEIARAKGKERKLLPQEGRKGKRLPEGVKERKTKVRKGISKSEKNKEKSEPVLPSLAGVGIGI